MEATVPGKSDSETKNTVANRQAASIVGIYNITCERLRENAQASDEKFTLIIAKDSKKSGMAGVYKGLFEFGTEKGTMLLSVDSERVFKRFNILRWNARHDALSELSDFGEAWPDTPTAPGASASASMAKVGPELKFHIHSRGRDERFYGGRGEITFIDDKYSMFTGSVYLSDGLRVEITGEKAETPRDSDGCKFHAEEWVRRWVRVHY